MTAYYFIDELSLT